MFDYRQALDAYSAVGQYSATKEAKAKGKAYACGNFACRICYAAITTAERARAEKDVQDFMQEQAQHRHCNAEQPSIGIPREEHGIPREERKILAFGILPLTFRRTRCNG